MESKAESILREEEEEGSNRKTMVGPADHQEQDGGSSSSREAIARLEQENALLRKVVEGLESTKKSLIERNLKLERLLEEGKHHYHHLHNEKGTIKADEAEIVVVLPPHLFMKTFALMRGSSKPLVLRVMAKEAVDIDRMRI